jgi:hypothetical protein
MFYERSCVCVCAGDEGSSSLTICHFQYLHYQQEDDEAIKMLFSPFTSACLAVALEEMQMSKVSCCCCCCCCLVKGEIKLHLIWLHKCGFANYLR